MMLQALKLEPNNLHLQFFQFCEKGAFSHRVPLKVVETLDLIMTFLTIPKSAHA